MGGVSGPVCAGCLAGDWALVLAEAVEMQSALPATWPWPEAGLRLRPALCPSGYTSIYWPLPSLCVFLPVVTCREHLPAEFDLGPTEAWDTGTGSPTGSHCLESVFLG